MRSLRYALCAVVVMGTLALVVFLADITWARTHSTKTVRCDVPFTLASEPSGPTPKGFDLSRTVNAAEISCNGFKNVYHRKKDFGALSYEDWNKLKAGDRFTCKLVEPRFTSWYLNDCRL